MKNSSKEKKDKIYTGHFRQEEMLMVKKKKDIRDVQCHS